MKHVTLYIALAVLLVLVTGCFSVPKIVCPDGTVVADARQCDTHLLEDVRLDDDVDDAPVVDDAPSVAEVPYDPAVKALLEKHVGKVKSLSFTYAPIILTTKGPATYAGDKYSWYEPLNRVRVDLHDATKIPKDTRYDTVYVNLASRTVQAYCLNKNTAYCPVPGEQRTAKFSDFDIVYPLDWLDEVPSTAFIKESKMFENRDVKVLRYEKDGLYVELFIDPFNGVPLRRAYFTAENYEARTLQGGVEYQDIAYNLVKDTDVVPK